MLRHAIFVLVLVGAAFAGGAAINGPGLAWLQRNLIGGPTIIVDGSSAGGAPAQAAKRFPSATPPPLFIDLGAKLPAKAQPAAPAPDPMAALPPESPGSPAARLLRLPEPDGPDLAEAAARPAPTPTPDPADDPALAAPLDLPTAAGAPALASASAPASASAAAAKADPVARLASTAGGPDPGPAPAAPAGSRDWAEVRRRLKALGVSRYSIDAETGGRVRFSCVIPMDGLRAVGHHFEAEGDDEFQAVEATVRRVNLWRATEPARAEP